MRQYLDKLLDRTKLEIFLGKHSAFLSSIMCSMKFSWNTECPIARTNGLEIQFNPWKFKELKPSTRKTLLLHELWHIARLHTLRLQTRDREQWNLACDIRINSDLMEEGASFEGLPTPWQDQAKYIGLHDLDEEKRISEEEIYNILVDQNKQNQPDPTPDLENFNEPNQEDNNQSGEGSNQQQQLIQQLSQEQQQQMISIVETAKQQAALQNQAGELPGDITTLLDQFIDPSIPWEEVLRKYLTDLIEEDYSWTKRNRRFNHIYLPSRVEEDGRLTHLVYFIDTSGSISDEQIVQFNSEIKYIKDFLNPEKLTVIQFDTRIRDIKDYLEEDEFKFIKVTGRGGTSLREVHDYIEKNHPTCAVIFSDLYCEPMEPVKCGTPIVWAITGRNYDPIQPDFGFSVMLPDIE